MTKPTPITTRSGRVSHERVSLLEGIDEDEELQTKNIDNPNETDVSMLNWEDTTARNLNETDVSMLKLDDTEVGNPEDSPTVFEDGINITSTQHNVREKKSCHTCEEEETEKEKQILCESCQKCFCVKCETSEIENEECKKEIYHEMLVANVASLRRKELHMSYTHGLIWQCKECSTQEDERSEQQIEMKIQIKSMKIENGKLMESKERLIKETMKEKVKLEKEIGQLKRKHDKEMKTQMYIIETHEKRQHKEIEESIKKGEEIQMIKTELELLREQMKQSQKNEEKPEIESVEEKKTTTEKDKEEEEKEAEGNVEETGKNEEQGKEVETKENPDEEGKKEEKETKSDKKIDTKCWYLENYGKCRNDKCRYKHEVCRNHQNRGYCMHKNNCWYVHLPENTSNRKTDEYCRFQLNCRNRSECKYVHKQDDYRKSTICKYDREGRCNKGQRCEYKHVRGSANPADSYPQRLRSQESERHDNTNSQRQHFQNWQLGNQPRNPPQNWQQGNRYVNPEVQMMAMEILMNQMRN